ncbi:MAG: adenosine deaminase family protein [Stellaceae bacterium]
MAQQCTSRPGDRLRRSSSWLRLVRSSWLAFLVLAALAACAPTPRDAFEATTRHLDAIRDDPALLTAFLRAFPKGGNLHNHLSGTVYAESYILWAIADGLCIDRRKLALVPPPCQGDLIPAAAARHDPALDAALIGSLSMKGFHGGIQARHDHFFAAFDKFAPAERGREGDMLAEALTQAARDHVLYLELMLSPGMPAARRLGKTIGWHRNFGRMRRALRRAGIDRIVSPVRQSVDRYEARARTLLHCAEPARASPGCAVTVRYLAQIIRTYPPAEVFAEDVLAFRLVRSDPRFVGLNIVGAEDNPISLRNYTIDMKMLGYLHRLYPKVPMSLHAGELVPGLRGVRPADLRFHVRQAVEIAHAQRIGHGVDIFHEDHWRQLMAEMAKKHILVEINLTSNADILGVTGDRHPFMTYWRAGVPVALSTDDEGVERIDLTHEYVLATREYHLDFPQLVTLSRNSIAYGFVGGASLWRTPGHFTPVAACAGTTFGTAHPGAACAAFLARSAKARLEWRLEADLWRFEARW